MLQSFALDNIHSHNVKIYLKPLKTQVIQMLFFPIPGRSLIWVHIIVTIQNGWNNRISYGCVYAQIRSGLGMHLGTFSNHDTVLFLLIVPIKGRFV